MDTSQIILLEDELNGFIADQQDKAQVEPTHGSPNIMSIHNKEIEAPTIGMKFDCDDSAYEFYK